MEPTKNIKEKLALFFATGSYFGYAPFAPGTVGSLWGIPLAFLVAEAGPIAGAIIIVIVTLAAIPIATKASKILNKKDPGSIVCDEIAGFAVAAFLVPFTATNMILVFILFRIFDILKPPPIRLIEKLPDGTGIVMDDIAAGLYTNICVQLIIRFVL